MIKPELLKIIADALENSPQQRITFADYMNLVLYHPQHGYYSSGIVEIGKKGDFFTSASLGADFGELLGEQFAQIWYILEQPSPFHLLEMGAGEGILAQDILSYFKAKYPQILANLEYIIVEESPDLITRQQEKLQDFNVSWKSLSDLENNFLIGCCFSNELIDAFPVHQVIINDGKLQEIYVTYNQDNFQEIIAEISTPEIREYFDNLAINFNNNYPENYRTEINLKALNWLNTISQKIKTGYLITIDYGYDAQRYYHPQRYQGTLQCYYQHRHHSNPYVNLGYQDITSHVNFTALEKYGEKLGLTKLGFTKQGMFLMALGLGERLQELSSGNYNLPQILQRRDALHQLINPSGLGNFGVLIQSKGLSLSQKNYQLLGLTTNYANN